MIRNRRRTGRRRIRGAAAIVALALSLLTGACSSGDEPKDSAGAAPSSGAALEGEWRTPSLSLDDMEASLRGQGFDAFVDGFRANAPFTADTVLVLRIEDGQWNLYGESGGKREAIDFDAEYRIDGDRVSFEHADGATTYEWSVDGDQLALEYAEGTMPEYEGIPDEVFQRALYMTSPFTRQG